MKKLTRKTKIAIVLIVIVITILVVAILFIDHSNRCRDIIGDGYAMGTDPKPVVIGNTCDL
jgi:hypothetical protein